MAGLTWQAEEPGVGVGGPDEGARAVGQDARPQADGAPLAPVHRLLRPVPGFRLGRVRAAIGWLDWRGLDRLRFARGTGQDWTVDGRVVEGGGDDAGQVGVLLLLLHLHRTCPGGAPWRPKLGNVKVVLNNKIFYRLTFSSSFLFFFHLAHIFIRFAKGQQKQIILPKALENIIIVRLIIISIRVKNKCFWVAIDVGDDYEDEAEAEPAELDAAAGIDDGVHAGVDPAEPGEDGEGDLRLRDAPGAQARWAWSIF